MKDISTHQQDEYARIASLLERRDLRLFLPAPWEAQFCREHDARAVKALNSTIAYVMLLYFGLGVALLGVASFDELGFWPASYSVFLLLIVFAWLLSVIGVFEKHYQPVLSVLVTVAVFYAVLHPALINDGVLVYLVHEGTIFVMVLVYLGMSLRLPYALAAGVGGALVAVMALLLFELKIDWHLTLSTYFGGSILGILLRYRDERYLRRDFLRARLMTLDNERIQAMASELERLSFVDGLTGLANRRYFDRTFEKVWRTCIREQVPVSLIMLDVDCFKAYNDHYGHQQGDQALRDLAHAVQDQVRRPQDLVARYGGEEFVVLLPWVDEVSAATVVENILAAIRELKLPHEASICGDFVSISAGVATQIPHANASASLLLGLADEALYRAKAEGRDCWRAAQV